MMDGETVYRWFVTWGRSTDEVRAERLARQRETLSNRFFRSLSDEELESARNWGGPAAQGINAGRAEREMRRRRALSA